MTIDLRKAYKQLPLSKLAMGDGSLCVLNPEPGEPEIFRPTVLPFGARAAVQGFYRASYSLWWIGLQLLKLHWTLFFDDFLVVGRLAEGRHVELILASFFSTLGWETSSEKGNSFNAVARALGVLIDLSDSKLLKVKVNNTENRGREIVSFIQSILDKGFYKPGELATLRGRVLFAEGQGAVLSPFRSWELMLNELMVGRLILTLTMPCAPFRIAWNGTSPGHSLEA